MVLIFIILSLLRGTSSKETLSIDLYKNSSVFYQLPGIFQGINLTYTVNCNTESENANLSSERAVLNTATLELDESLGKVSLKATQMPTRWFDGYGFGFYFTNTTVVCVKVDTNKALMNIYWFYDFSYERRNISGVQPLIINDKQFLVFVAFQSQANNNYYIIDYENITDLKVSEVNISNLDAIESMELYYNFRSNFVVISGNYENVLSLFIVDCSNPNNVTRQNISFIYSEANKKSINIRPVSAFIFKNTADLNLIVLDESKYLIVYTYLDGNFYESNSLSLQAYNDPKFIYPYTYNGEYQQQLFVYTNNGILLVDLSTMSEVLLMDSIVTGVSGFFESNKFFYLLNEIDSSPGLAIAHLDYPQSILFNNKLDNDKCEKNTFWGFFQGEGQPLLLKINTNYATLTTIQAGIPLIEFYANASSNFNCSIKAADVYSEGSENIQVQNVEINVLDDSLYDIRILDPESNSSTKKFYLTQNYSQFSLPTHFVSGWDKTCVVENKNLIGKNETLIITSTYKNNFQIFKNSSLGLDSIKVYFLDIFIINIKESLVELTSITDSCIYLIYISNVSSVRKVTVPYKQSALLFLYEDSNIYFYPYPSGASKTYPFNTFKEITIFDAVSNYLILANSSFLQIYSYNNITLNYDLLSNKIISSPSSLKDIKIISRNKSNLANLLYLQLTNLLPESIIQVFNMDTISLYAFPYFLSQKKVPNFDHFIVTPSNCFFFHDEEIKVYDSLMNQKVYGFPIKVRNTWGLQNSFVGIYEDQIVVFNSSESLLSKAVFFSFKQQGKLIGFNEFKGSPEFEKNGSLVGITDNLNIVLYFLDCPSPNYSNCEPSAPFKVDYLSDSYSKDYNFTGELTVHCSNNKSHPDNIIFNVIFYTYGMKIYLRNSQYIVKSIAYSTEGVFPVRQYVQGSDLQLTLTINGKTVSKSSKNAPFNIENSVNLNSKIPTYEQIYGMSLIKNTTYFIISTESGYIFLYDFISGTKIASFSAFQNFNSVCPIIETVARTTNSVLFALSCITKSSETLSKVEKTSVIVISFSIRNFSTNYGFQLSNPEFEVGSLRVVNANNKNFVLILVERTNRINNHVQVVFGEWNELNVTLVQNFTLNFYTLNLERFLCEGADGFYNYKGDLELYLVDSYFGLRVLNFSKGVFTEVYNYHISQPVKSIGYCGKILYVGCLDTSVICFGSYNKKFEYLSVMNPYNNASSNYSARSGYINCDNYYQPSFLALPIESSKNYVMRIMNTMIEPASSVLRDISISAYRPKTAYYSNAYFINSSMFFVADTVEGEILVFNIRNPFLAFPKFSSSEFQIIEKNWGNSPFNYSLKITSGGVTLSTKSYLVDRGVVKVSNSSVSTQIATWKVALIIAGVLIALIIIGVVTYKYFWKRKERLEEIELEESERRSSALYRSTMQFFVINRTSY